MTEDEKTQMVVGLPPRTRFYDKSISRLIEIGVITAGLISPAIIISAWVAAYRWWS